MKLKNTKTNVVKDVEDKLVGDYLSTQEWVIDNSGKDKAPKDKK